MHLVGFIIRIYHDARSSKCQNIKINLKEIGGGGVERIDLAQGMEKWRVHMKALINLRFPLQAGNFVMRRGTISFSRRIMSLQWRQGLHSNYCPERMICKLKYP